MAGFAQAAPEYVACGAAVVPCGGSDGKRPLVNWRNIKRTPGSRAIKAWSDKFADANLGLLTGISRITVVDVDTSDDEFFANCLRRFGDSPLVSRTPRGGRHIFYRSNGESSRAKVDGLPIDVRGRGGFLVLPPSQRPDGGSYELIRGRVEDFKSLPTMNVGSLRTRSIATVDRPFAAAEETGVSGPVAEGLRNNTLWRRAMSAAWGCSSYEDLLGRVEALNVETCSPPLPAGEVCRISTSAWQKHSSGQNHLGRNARLYLDVVHMADFIRHPDVAVFISVIRYCHAGYRDEFPLSDAAMAASGHFKEWSRGRIRNAIRAAVDLGYLVCVNAGGRFVGDAALYRFASPTVEGETGTEGVFPLVSQNETEAGAECRGQEKD